MRGARWLLLVAIIAIVYGVGITYRTKKSANQSHALEKPQPLPPELDSTSQAIQWTQTDQKTGCKTVQLAANGLSKSKDASHSDLTDVSLKIYHKCEDKFDLVKSAAATYYPSENRLYSEGDVAIMLGEPGEGEPPPNLVSIQSSGVNFDVATGHADTDRPSQFTFKNGSGEAVGASYDPPSHDLLMKGSVKVDWQPVGPNARPMHIEAPSLEYHESAGEIDLRPTGRMTRENSEFEGENPVIHLQDDGKGHKIIRGIDTGKAHGTDTYPNRKLNWAADRVWVSYNQDGIVEKISGEGNAQLVSTAEASETDVAANRVDLFFDAQGKESVLSHVSCNGHAVVTSKPLPAAGRQPAETHTLRSEAVEMKMRPGGRDIETVAAREPGTVEFLPNLPVQHHRVLQGKDMVIAYAPHNRIESFQANDVKTTTDPNADELKHSRAVSVTQSRTLTARFDPQTSQILSMEQSGNFTYQEGERKARADKASLDDKQNVITLDNGAVVSDATGSTSADHIRMDERNGDFTADGSVNSSRLPEKDPKKNSQMLSGDAPLQAQARRMESTNQHRHTRYEGNVRLWQGANSIRANTIEIDRDKHGLVADGNVISDLWEEPKDPEKKKTTQPVLTKVLAPHLVYTDETRLAFYSGGVKLDRAGMQMKSKELRAWLANSDADSRLDKAFADGSVEIVGNSKGRDFNAVGEHVEYYTGDQTVHIKGGAPKLMETVNGKPRTMQGTELTYSANDGSLTGTGAGDSRIPGKKK